MGLIFADDDKIVACPSCKYRYFTEKDIYAYERTDNGYKKKYAGTVLYCSSCGAEVIHVNKHKVVEEPQHTNT